MRLKFLRVKTNAIIESISDVKEEDPDTLYIKKYKKRFLDTFDKHSGVDYNLNIDPVFYDRKKFNECMKIPGNEIELKWKSKILIESTPVETLFYSTTHSKKDLYFIATGEVFPTE